MTTSLTDPFLASNASSLGPGIARTVLRLNPDGSQDVNFTQRYLYYGPVDPGDISSIALQADGAMLLGGSFDRIITESGSGFYLRTNLARLTSNGDVDAFRPPSGRVNGLLLQSDGAILVMGGVGETV